MDKTIMQDDHKPHRSISPQLAEWLPSNGASVWYCMVLSWVVGASWLCWLGCAGYCWVLAACWSGRRLVIASCCSAECLFLHLVLLFWNQTCKLLKYVSLLQTYWVLTPFTSLLDVDTVMRPPAINKLYNTKPTL